MLVASRLKSTVKIHGPLLGFVRALPVNELNSPANGRISKLTSGGPLNEGPGVAVKLAVTPLEVSINGVPKAVVFSKSNTESAFAIPTATPNNRKKRTTAREY